MSSPKRIAIIGGGAAGIITSSVLQTKLRHVKASVVVFEKSATLGGVWSYNNKKDKDLDHPNPMYTTLRTNLPKEIMAVPFHPFIELKDSFVKYDEVQRYLETYASTYNVPVQLSTTVTDITRSDNDWFVTVQEEGNNISTTKRFDHVIVCNGHYSEPVMPSDEELKVSGMDAFPGVVMHSNVYDGPDEKLFGGKRVLVVGGKNSATDIARETSTVATSVHCSDRNGSATMPIALNGCGDHNNLFHVPGIAKFLPESNECEFTNGARATIDVICYATGYRYSFEDFLPKGYLSSSGRRVKNLYEHLFHEQYPNLSFVGIPFSVVPFPLFYAQALRLAAVIDMRCTLPSVDERVAWRLDMEKELNSKGYLNDSKYHYMGPAQWKYMRKFAMFESEEKRDALLVLLDLYEKVYNDIKRPSLVGLPDTYRESVYHLNTQHGTFIRKDPPN